VHRFDFLQIARSSLPSWNNDWTLFFTAESFSDFIWLIVYTLIYCRVMAAKFEQAVVTLEYCQAMEAGTLDAHQTESMAWTLVCDANRARLLNAEGHVFINLSGMAGSAFKMVLSKVFVQTLLGLDVVHHVFTHHLYPEVACVIRGVPSEPVNLVLDLFLACSQQIRATFRKLEDEADVMLNIDLQTVRPITCSRLIVSAKCALFADGMSLFRTMNLYEQGSQVPLSTNAVIWKPSWEQPRGLYVLRRRFFQKRAPRHPSMAYWRRREMH
jgi:hypothetical protein